MTKIKGIPIRLHFTLIIVFFLIAWTLAASLMPETHPGLTRIGYWIMGILGAVILFVSVLLHELAHSIISLRYGLKVRQIMLFIFGGVSDIEEDEKISKDFQKEFKIAVMGPITSFVIAGIFEISWLILSNIHTSSSSTTTIAVVTSMITTNEIKSIAEGILQYGASVNVLLGGFNLIPAFPLDGGRILRSALLRWRRNYDQSTKTAVRIGIAISYGFMAFGFITMLSGSFIGGMWILLIGWFLNSGAQSYLQRYELSSILSEIRLSDIMNTNIITIKANEEEMTINRLIRDYFNIYSKDSFPVINDQKYLIGMVTFKDAWNIQEQGRAGTAITRNIMIPLQDLIVMQPNRTANEALMQMTRKQMGKVFVCNEQGMLIGLVSKTDLLNAASERKQYVEAVKKEYVV